MLRSRLIRRSLCGLAVGVASLWAGVAEAADCGEISGANVEWVVPFSPGGGFDVYSRLFQPYIERHLGAHVAVVSVTGAGGVLGAKAIRDAAPDGHTLGIVNAGGLLTSRLFGDVDVPSPADDFTVLGRFVTQNYTWMVAGDSPIRTIYDALAHGRSGDLVVGVLEVGSGAFLAGAVVSEVLGLRPEIVAGYRGSKDTLMAVIRGDVDVMSGTFKSHLDAIDAGEVRSILQISDAPVDEHPSLQGVPLLVGPGGIAQATASSEGHDPSATDALAGIAANLSGLGRFIVAPKGLSPSLQACLEGAVADALADPAFVSAAKAVRRSLEPLSGVEAAALARKTEISAGSLRPFIEKAVARVRG